MNWMIVRLPKGTLQWLEDSTWAFEFILFTVVSLTDLIASLRLLLNTLCDSLQEHLYKSRCSFRSSLINITYRPKVDSEAWSTALYFQLWLPLWLSGYLSTYNDSIATYVEKTWRRAYVVKRQHAYPPVEIRGRSCWITIDVRIEPDSCIL